MTGPRVQSGFRLEKRLLKVLKALAALWDLSVGDIVENIIHAGLVGEAPFSAAELRQIGELARIYGLELDECPEADHTGGGL